MRLYLFLASFLAFFCAIPFFTYGQSKPKVNCTEIAVKAEITDTHEGKSNGEVILKFTGTDNDKEYQIFLNCLGCAEPKKAVDQGFKNLKQGYYDIYVIDKKGCSKQLNIQVK